MWRVEYSPDGRAFAIWWVLYLTTIGSCAAQAVGLGVDTAVVFDWSVNLAWASTWTLAGLWVIVFDKETKVGLWLAAVVLSAACGSGACALALLQPWATRPERAAVILTAVPLSLLTSWLFVASLLAWGTAVRASTQQSDACKLLYDEGRRRYRWFPKNEFAKRLLRSELQLIVDARSAHRVTCISWIVLLGAALVVGAAAVILPDPVLPLPLLWVVLLQRSFPRSWLYAVAVLAILASIAVAATRPFLR